MAAHLVECIVPPDILAQEEQPTARVKERAGVEAAGSLKCLLRLRQFSRELKNCLGVDGRRSFDRQKLLHRRLNRGFAANSAARRAEDMTAQFRGVETRGIGQGDVDDVLRWSLGR